MLGYQRRAVNHCFIFEIWTIKGTCRKKRTTYRSKTRHEKLYLISLLPFIDLPLKPGPDFCRMFLFFKDVDMFTLRLILSYLLFKEAPALSGKYSTYHTVVYNFTKCLIRNSFPCVIMHHFCCCCFFFFFCIQAASGTSRISTGTRHTNWQIMQNLCARQAANDLQPMRGCLETMFATRRGTLLTPLCMPWRTFYQTRTSSYGQGMCFRLTVAFSWAMLAFWAHSPSSERQMLA